MAKIKIEGVLESLDYDLKKALRATVEEYVKQPSMSDTQLYRLFVKNAYHKCNTWERVPDKFIDRE